MSESTLTPISPPLVIARNHIIIAYVCVAIMATSVSGFAGMWIAVGHDITFILYRAGTPYLGEFSIVTSSILGLCAAIIWTRLAVRRVRTFGRLHAQASPGPITIAIWLAWGATIVAHAATIFAQSLIRGNPPLWGSLVLGILIYGAVSGFVSGVVVGGASTALATFLLVPKE